MRRAPIEKIAAGRPPIGAISISFVTPGGVLALPTKDGAYVCRTHLDGCVIHLDAADDGLIAELVTGSEPIPWRNKKQRDAALDQIMNERADLDEDLRERLVAHVEATPWYDN